MVDPGGLGAGEPSRDSGRAMKKILFTNFHPHRLGGGGHTRYIRTLLESDLRSRFDFGVAAPEGSAVRNMGRALGVPAFVCDFPGHLKEIPQVIQAVRRFERTCREWKPDLIHANGSRDQFIVVLWKKVFRRATPCVRSHLAVRNIPDNFYHRWLYGKMVQGNVYISHSARNVSWAAGSLQPPNSRIIPIGLDVSFWAPMAKSPLYLQKFGLFPSDFVFGSHAGMGWHKRTDLFLQGAAIALRQGARPFKIMLRGKEEEVRESRRLSRELGLDNVFYADHEPDPRPYLSVIDVGFLLSEAIEAISFAARELMSMGKPLISTNYAGLVENVDDGLNGRLVECGDAPGVAKAIRWFLDLAPAALARLGRNAREKAECVFSGERQAQGMAEFYREVFERSGTRA